MTEQMYKIRFSNGLQEFEIIGDKEFVQEKYKEFLKLMSQKIPNIERQSIEKKEVSKRKETIFTFLLRYKPKSNLEKAILIARWHEIQSENEDAVINSTDLTNAIKRDKPKNPTDVLAQCVKKGWMSEEGEKDGLKSYRLTTPGIEEIDKIDKVDE